MRGLLRWVPGEEHFWWFGAVEEALRDTSQTAFTLNSTFPPGKVMNLVSTHYKWEMKKNVNSELWTPSLYSQTRKVSLSECKWNTIEDEKLDFSTEISWDMTLKWIRVDMNYCFYSPPCLSHFQGVHEALREVHSPHQAANWSFSALLHNLLPERGKSTERNLIPYHYLPDIYSTFLQTLCREYLTSHINFQASRIVQLKTKEAEQRTATIKAGMRESLQQGKKNR